MKFLVDMPLSPALAVWLAQQGHDAIHALEIGLDRAPDEVILRHAKEEQRVVVTADLDYPRLLALAQAEEPFILQKAGWSDYLYRQTQDKKTVRRINKLILDKTRNGYEGIGKPEALSGDLSGWWSLKKESGCKHDEYCQDRIRHT